MNCQWELINGMFPLYENLVNDLNLPLSGWVGGFGPLPAPFMHFQGPTLSYGATAFMEDTSDTGVLLSATNIQVDITQETFTGVNGNDLVAAGKINVINLPAGLSAAMIRMNDSTLRLNITGAATNHANSNQGSFTLEFLNSAFTGNDTSLIENPVELLDIDFIQKWNVGANGQFVTLQEQLTVLNWGISCCWLHKPLPNRTLASIMISPLLVKVLPKPLFKQIPFLLP